jgi:hypothetical protein
MSSHWLADAFGALLEISKMTDAITRARAEAHNKRPVTLFERSVASAQFPTKISDATIRVAPFLEDSLGALKHYVATLLQHEDFSLVSRYITLFDLVVYLTNNTIERFPSRKGHATFLVGPLPSRPVKSP